MKTKVKNKKLSTILGIAFVVICGLYLYFSASDYKYDIPKAAEGKLSIYFIDVGQGDSELIVSPDGHRMLIDAGTGASQDLLLRFLSKHECDAIDYAVFTHPHEDHIGGADNVVSEVNVSKVLMPDVVSSSVTYEKLLRAIDETDTQAEAVWAGDSFMLGEFVKVKILAPVSIDEDNFNDCSIVLRIEYGDNSFIFMGDAETPVEEQLLTKYGADDLASDLIKIGHHGSTTSSSEKFLDAVSPNYAVIECGKGNTYGHPRNEILERLMKRKVNIMRTDESGTIMITSDGRDITIDSYNNKAA